jgi:hypothetical protein
MKCDRCDGEGYRTLEGIGYGGVGTFRKQEDCQDCGGSGVIEPDMETAQQAISDFLRAVDRGYLGPMPSGFHASAFVQALRDQIKS